MVSLEAVPSRVRLLKMKVTVVAKLIAGLSLIAVIGTAVGATGIWYINSIEATLNNLTDNATPMIETSDDLIAFTWEANKVAEEVIGSEDLPEVRELTAEFGTLQNSFDATYAELKTLVKDPDLLDELETASKEHEEFGTHASDMFAAHREALEEEEKAKNLLDAFDGNGAGLIVMLDEFANENEEEMQKLEDEGDRLEASGAASAGEVNAILGGLFETEYPVVEAALKLQRLVMEMQDTAGEYLATEDPTELKKPLTEFLALSEAVRPHLAVLTRLAESDEDKADASALESAFEDWYASATGDELLFDTHRDMMEAQHWARELTTLLESDADRVAAALNTVADKADAISDSADEAAAEVVSVAQFMVSAMVAVLAIIAISLMVIIVRTVTRPIKQMTAAMQTLADGDTAVEVPALSRQDEIGEMAGAVQVFKENAIRVGEMEKEQAAAAEQAAERKRQEMNQLADDFDDSVGQIVGVVGDAASDMQSTATTMSGIAEQTVEKSERASSASENAATNVAAVAAAAEEMATSIQEISRKVTQSTTIVDRAVSSVAQTTENVRTLDQAANRIGEVVTLIQSIAGQTNLLALNATIEAARAGEAGKGFAVVASEVKNLATQTGNATEEISTQINDVQSQTSEVVNAIEEISRVMNEVNEISASIAAAIEEQGASTSEISRNVQIASTITDDMKQDMAQVLSASQESGAASTQVLSVSGELASQAEQLKAKVHKFVETVRAA